ncbi:hypothetical protein BXP70_28455 [Hymenobacter crusticola]|uniref:Secretion system C-terminal sorting domain-containing protein n=1 Tax=Hymenobacter crusticola TaxID=1770526 RepID=A0A243W7G0_9BACT|nr:hypothetical protein BXP70_28455 [Hymenobacter crusticola]
MLAPKIQAQSWQWATAPSSASANGISHAVGTAVDGAGNTIVVGNFSNAVTFGSTTLYTPAQTLYVARLNSNGAWTQVISISNPNKDYIEAFATALDGVGNVVIAGLFSGTITFGTITLTSPSVDECIFVARLSTAGVWTQAVRGANGGNIEVTGLAVRANGDAAIVGNFLDKSITFGTSTLTNIDTRLFSGSRDLYTARLSNDGNWTQAVRAGGTVATNAQVPTHDVATAVVIDESGTVTVAGYFTGTTIGFGPLTLTNVNPAGGTAQPADLFVARLNNAGTWTQAVRAGGEGNDRAMDLALANNGDAVVCGSFSAYTTNFGAITLTNPGISSYDLFVARLNSAGTWTQAVRAGGNGFGDDERAVALAVDGNDNVLITGLYFGSSILFGPLTLDRAGAYSLFVAKLSSMGSWLQAARAGGNAVIAPSSITVDGSGSVTVVGEFSTPSISFGSISLTAAFTSAFVARLTGLVTSTKQPVGHKLPLAILPNPAHTSITLTSLANEISDPVLVFDATGREVARRIVPIRTTSMTLDVSSLKPGLYVVRHGKATGKVLIE